MSLQRAPARRSYSASSLLANAALPAFFGAVLAILAVLARVAGISARACCRQHIEWNLIDEKNRQQNLRKGDE